MNHEKIRSIQHDLNDLGQEWAFQRRSMEECYREYIVHRVLQSCTGSYTHSHLDSDLGQIPIDVVRSKEQRQWKIVLDIQGLWNQISIPLSLTQPFGVYTHITLQYNGDHTGPTDAIADCLQHIREQAYSIHTHPQYTAYACIPMQDNNAPAWQHYRR